MGKRTSWLVGTGLGLGLMYFLDPVQGNRRRALVRDQAVSIINRTDMALEKSYRDMRNRVKGAYYELSGMLSERDVPDWILAERVRSKLGFLTSHPGAVEVDAHKGIATLSGSVLVKDVDRLVAGVSAVRGIKTVENNLTVHNRVEDIPSLQGSEEIPSVRPERSMYWTPTTRLLAALGAVGLFVFGRNKRGLIGTAFSLTGIGLAFRALTNLEVSRIFGIAQDPRVIDISKTVNINVPVEDVYRLWSSFPNFPIFMSNIKEIHDLGGERSHWVVKGPAGIPVEFDAKILENKPNEVISWETEPGSTVKHHGIVRFQPNPDGSTQVIVRMTYNPPAGLVGHGVASLMGTDPKQAMDEDLIRLKSLLETGKTSAKGEEIYRSIPSTGGSPSPDADVQ